MTTNHPSMTEQKSTFNSGHQFLNSLGTLNPVVFFKTWLLSSVLSPKYQYKEYQLA